MFERKGWLSRCQIQGFFSRLSASIKQGSQRRIELLSGGDLDTDTEEDNDLAEEYACQLDEGHLKETREVVLGKVGLTHPILYDIYNLCTFVSEGKLPTFKVKMLKEICSHFHLPFRSRDTKAVLVTKVKEMASECSCNTQS